MEQRSSAEHLLLIRGQVVNLKGVSIFPEVHPLRRADKILLCLILTVQFDQDFLQISACFHKFFLSILRRIFIRPFMRPCPSDKNAVFL